MNKVMSLMAVGFALSASPVFAADATMQADAQGIDSACQADAATAGCGSEVVGKGLLKCLFAYKKANAKTFHFSEGCKAAMKKMHADKKAGM
jgi:hypothetical protein